MIYHGDLMDDKKPYYKPNLAVYGDLKRITKKISGPPDGHNDFGPIS